MPSGSAAGDLDPDVPAGAADTSKLAGRAFDRWDILDAGEHLLVVERGDPGGAAEPVRGEAAKMLTQLLGVNERKGYEIRRLGDVIRRLEKRLDTRAMCDARLTADEEEELHDDDE